MTQVEINKQVRLSEHFTLSEMCKTNVKYKNVPNEAQVENLKRLCGWLEMLRGETQGKSQKGGIYQCLNEIKAILFGISLDLHYLCPRTLTL